MKKVMVFNEDYCALVDDEDWTRVVNAGTWYVHHGVAVLHGRLGGISMQRFILNNPASEIDHIDHNKLNNQKSNLRLASRSQNCANRRKFRNNKTGYIGVFQLPSGSYQAYLNVNRKRIHLGAYKDPIVAAKIRDKAALEHFGSFAQLNFPL